MISIKAKELLVPSKNLDSDESSTSTASSALFQSSTVKASDSGDVSIQ